MIPFLLWGKNDFSGHSMKEYRPNINPFLLIVNQIGPRNVTLNNFNYLKMHFAASNCPLIRPYSENRPKLAFR